jgi:hypothetical protein
MPNKDGTGPDGQGPQTGRGQGNCNNQKTNINDNLARTNARPQRLGRRNRGR